MEQTVSEIFCSTHFFLSIGTHISVKKFIDFVAHFDLGFFES
jgi:hypothetical protein